MPTTRRTASTVVLAAATILAAAPGLCLAAESYLYDSVGRLSDVSYQNGGSIHYTYDANGNVLSVVNSLATAVEEGETAFQFALGLATPNPAGSVRNVFFTLPAHARVALRVFDVTGRLTATLVDRDLDRGRHNVRFFTDRWAAGVYFFRLESAGKIRSGRMVVLR